MHARSWGIVTELDGRTSTVRLEGAGAATLRCLLRGTVKGPEGSSRVAVGDRVEVSHDGRGGEGMIEAIAGRTTRLARGRGRGEQVIAANVDRLAIVCAAKDPDWRPGFVDRMLCAAHKGGLDPVILVSKVDLLAPLDADPAAAALEARVRRDAEVFRALGYPVLEVSAASGVGLDELRAALRDRVTVFSGQSGVGKSSLVNALEPGMRLATREVSRGTRKGRHTTTSARLLPLSGGGLVLDTPGVRSFGFYDLEPREVRDHFREIARVGASCRFRDCLHLDEPECAVRYAVEEGVIDARRFESYRRLVASTQGEDLRE